ncbi:MAG: transglutaminase domain-containing protein [Thermoplasmatota archaeon]
MLFHKSVGKKLFFSIVFVILLLVSTPAQSLNLSNLNTTEIQHRSDVLSVDSNQKEISLLRGEHYIYLNATENVDNFHFWFVFPPDYGYQIPIYIQIYEDTTADILNYEIQDDEDGLNKLLHFYIGSILKDHSVLLHFSVYVLTKNHDFSDIPEKQRFPLRIQLPEETKQWLSASEVVQKNSILIRLKARQLRGINNDMIRYVNRVAPFIKYHRFGLFLIQLNFRVFFSQDARTTLLINGENVGRSHLACALFRSQNIPARVLLVHRDQGFWTQMHYIVEYYILDYGWVLLDSTDGKTPYDTKNQIINRICFIQDEQDTKDDYIYPLMKGLERWMWIDTDHVYPYYYDCDQGSKSQMFRECDILSNSERVEYAFVKTQLVYHQYEKYLCMNLTDENKLFFENATLYQKTAIDQLKQTQNLNEYILYIDLAYDEYKKIQL